MSMIIKVTPVQTPVSRSEAARPDRVSAAPCGVRRLVPAEVAGAFACYRVQRTRSIAGALEGFERFAAHRSVDVEVRHAGHGTEFLEHEEDDAVMHHAAPVASANQVALFFAQPGILETCFRIAKERSAMARLDHPVQIVVDAERLHAALERERVGAFEPFDAGKLICHVASLALDRA